MRVTTAASAASACAFAHSPIHRAAHLVAVTADAHHPAAVLNTEQQPHGALWRHGHAENARLACQCCLSLGSQAQVPGSWGWCGGSSSDGAGRVAAATAPCMRALGAHSSCKHAAPDCVHGCTRTSWRSRSPPARWTRAVRRCRPPAATVAGGCCARRNRPPGCMGQCCCHLPGARLHGGSASGAARSL